MATVEQQVAETQNGVAATTAGEIPVENPATGETIRTVPDLGAEQVAEIAARGRAAQPEWEAYGFDGRARVMRRAQKWLMDNAERVVETIVSETGKTYEDAELAEIGYAGNAFGFWAKYGPRYLADEHVKSSQVLVKGKKLINRFRPLGLIGVIGPWNYPLTNSFGDCIPALMAGNSVILKPSEITPLTSLLLAEGMRECGLPENVLQIATGRGETGAALVEHVDMIMFTGSTKTGRKVAEAAARRLIPCSLELGGKDPMIVLSDADVERAANFATYYSMQNAGQTCISIERVYVEDPVYDEFVAKVSEKVRELRVGKPEGPGTVEVGAITFPPQLDTIKDHVADAVQKGARILTGGSQAPGAGRFFEPTVLVDVDHSMKCMTEETFGPTLPIMKVRDADEAVRLANDSPYGLGASVFSRDTERGEAIARRVEAGAANVNDAMINYTVLELPMGGAKASGLGSRHGAGGIRKYASQQAIVVTPKLAMKKEVFMYPYKSRTTRLLARFFKFMYGRGKRD
ncbi:MAG TPA: aldehyde dehydrogenase family protein [Solirubrobacteraceae bacterium]|jgi:acyl-CoA reductase-like NAD-dependent aldehyde dehydrogenase|nr:aldehyde dehydrogenase family protein [Solirubrobacteraceae bacterium]